MPQQTKLEYSEFLFWHFNFSGLSLGIQRANDLQYAVCEREGGGWVGGKGKVGRKGERDREGEREEEREKVSYSWPCDLVIHIILMLRS